MKHIARSVAVVASFHLLLGASTYELVEAVVLHLAVESLLTACAE